MLVRFFKELIDLVNKKDYIYFSENLILVQIERWRRG